MTQSTSSTSSPTPTARLGRDDYLSAARRALHAYPGPVGELVRREISAHMDALVRTGDPFVPGLVTQRSQLAVVCTSGLLATWTSTGQSVLNAGGA
jgi:hypothetical protein